MKQKVTDRIQFCRILMILTVLTAVIVVCFFYNLNDAKAEDGLFGKMSGPGEIETGICGLKRITESEKNELCQGKKEEYPAGIDSMLLYNGKQTAYDKETNTCYVFHPSDSDQAEGKFHIVCDHVSIYWIVSDDEHGFSGKEADFFRGMAGQILVDTADSWCVINVVFTGLSVVSISAASEIGTDYTEASFAISGEDGESGRTEVQASAMIRESDSKEVISVNLSAGEQDNYNPDLLGMGNVYGWKLYRVPAEDTLRMMFAYRIWEICCLEEALRIPGKYVELVLNHEYRGLYILRPKVSDYLKNELPRPRTVLDTNDLKKSEIPDDLYQQYEADNLYDFGLFLQLTYAYANIYDDIRIIKSAGGNQYVIPGKLEYAFGTFPHRYSYLAWNYESRMITSEDLRLKGEAALQFDQETGRRWRAVRETDLSNQNADLILSELMQELRFSGYAARNGLTVPYDRADELWTDSPAEYGDVMEAQKEKLYIAFASRCNQIDFMMTVPKAESGDVALDDIQPASSDLFPETVCVVEGDEYRGFLDIGFDWNYQDKGYQVKLFVDGASAYLFMPACALMKQIRVSCDEKQYEVLINGRPVRDMDLITDLEAGKTYDLEIRHKGENKCVHYTLESIWSENLPAIFVETFNGTIAFLDANKEHFEPGNLTIFDENGDVLAREKIQKIHMRGSSSAGVDQNSYTVILEKETDLLNMGAAGKWCLIGSGFDSTRLRNALSYSLAKDMELKYAVDYRFVDLYFNGEYHGFSLLVEPVEMAENRVDPEEVTCLLKVDRMGDKEPVYLSNHNMQVFSGKELTTEEIDRLQDKMDDIICKINECKSPEQYKQLQQYVDTESFAKRYLISAITNEVDSNGLSMFYYILKGKLYAGPVWDFDRSFGNEISGRAGDVRYNTYPAGYGETLMLNNPEFRELIREEAHRYADALCNIEKNAALFRNTYRNSLRMTHNRFPDSIQGFADFGDVGVNIDYLVENAKARLALITDTIEHPEEYCHVVAGERIIWLRKGDTLTKELIDAVKRTFDWTAVTYMDGSAVDYNEPVAEDMELTGL